MTPLAAVVMVVLYLAFPTVMIVMMTRKAKRQLAKPMASVASTDLPLPDDLAERLPRRSSKKTGVVDGRRVWVADRGGIEGARWIAVSLDMRVAGGSIGTTMQTSAKGSATNAVITQWNRIVSNDEKAGPVRLGDGWLVTKIRTGQAADNLDWDQRIKAYCALANLVEREANLHAPTVEPPPTQWQQPRGLPVGLSGQTLWEQPGDRVEQADPEWR